MTSSYSRPVIPLLVAQVIGIVLGSKFPGYGLWAGGVILLCGGWLLYRVVRDQSAKLLPLLFFLALGYVSLQPWISPLFPSNHLVYYLDDRRWDIEGVIADRPLMADNRQKFKLQVQRLGHDGDVVPVVGRLRVTVAGDAPVLHRGDRILFNSKIRSLRNFKNPGGFDYKRYMFFQGICATTYSHARRVTILDRRPPNFLLDLIDRTHHRIARIITETGKEPQSGVLKALIVGDRSHIGQDTREAFNRAGVGHLLAISGLHIGIVATMAFLFFEWLMTHIKPLLWRAWTRKTAALLALIPVWFYGFISGFSPSTQRALIMVSVFLMTFLFEREHDMMNTIALAAMAILIIFPPSMYSISFQLSFTAVLAIIIGFTCISELRGPHNDGDQPALMQTLKKRSIDFLWVSVFAICGTMPLVMFYFNQISLVGVVANFLVVPVVGFTVVPLGLIAVFLSSFCFHCAAWSFALCGAILKLCLGLIEIIAGLEFAAVKTFTPTLLEIGCYYVLFWAALSLIQNYHTSAEGEQQSESAPRRTCAAVGKKHVSRNSHTLFTRFFRLVADTIGYLRVLKKLSNQLKFAASLAVIATLVLICDTGYWLYYRFWHQDLRITIMDVGQGNAALLELPDGYTMLIDGGGFSDNSIFDIGARVVAPFLWRNKIKTIDTLVLSHPNSDHLNGLIYIAEHFNVQKIWTNSEARDTLGYRKLMEAIARRRIISPSFRQLPRKHMIHGVEINILYPSDNFLEKKVVDKWRHTNNNSMVMRVSLGSISFLFPGDIMAEAEKELIDLSRTKLASTVLLAPHHGSRSSSTSPFLDCVSPQIVVISAGWKNSFKFPHPAVLQLYRQRGYQIYRTDTSGALTFITDGQNLVVKPFIDDNFK